jgi:hypothetical protein
MEKKNDSQPTTIKQKYDFVWNIVFGILFFPTILGIYFLLRDTSKFRKDLKMKNPSYKFPELSDLKLVLLILPIIIVLKVILESSFMHITEKIMKSKYKNPNDEKNFILGKIYKRKLASHIFKGSFYLFMTLFAYFILDQVDYFPKTLLGHGYMPNMFLKGYPNSFYHYKPKYFDLHYIICLSYFSCDLIWLLFVYEKQSDFFNMLLHHICTISLIIFSYMTNYSNIGSIVLILHNATDVVIHFIRLLLQTDCNETIKDIFGLFVTLFFLYLRLYVFGDAIYTIWHYITWDWGWVTFCLWGFLTFLYIMHVNWSIMMVQKILVVLIGIKLSDTFNYDDSVKKKLKSLHDTNSKNK